MSKAEHLSRQLLDVRGGVADLMTLVRMLRTGDREALPETLQLLEDALFAIGGELMMLPGQLAEAEVRIAHDAAEAYAFLMRCQELWDFYEALARATGEPNQLVAAAGGKIVGTSDPTLLPPNVTPIPTGVMRAMRLAAIERQGGEA